MDKTLGIYGSGGLGKETLVIAKELNYWDRIILIDDNPKSDSVNDVEVCSYDYVLNHYKKTNLTIVIALGEPSIRRKVYEKVVSNEFNLDNLFYKDYKKPFDSVIGVASRSLCKWTQLNMY